jgi:diguanylate cyclase (GGDEF)-like protein
LENRRRCPIADYLRWRLSQNLCFFSKNIRCKITKVCTKVTWNSTKVSSRFFESSPILSLVDLKALYIRINEVGQVDWSKLPDVAVVALLTVAFASVARQGHNSVSGVWLAGWLMIVLHFFAIVLLPAPGHWGDLANFVSMASLVSAGVLFMWASVPYRMHSSSRWMVAAVLATYTLYLGLLVVFPVASWLLAPAAALMGALPLAITLSALPRFIPPLRWAIVVLNLGLSIFLLIFQNRPGYGQSLVLNAVLFTVYFGCCIHFWCAYKRATAGAFITIAGFFAWAAVFVIGPFIFASFPNFHLESEVWNLPKYVVAVGMILLLLEDQIEHNKYLALHDELTGLPNRRLFQDRLASALERARRTGSQAALLLVDLDRFKQVNDTVGHHIGDELLKRVSGAFLSRVRRSDTVARTGGDEFSVILEEPTNREEAERVSHSLTQLLDNPFQLEGHMVRVGATVGIAVFPQDASDAESLCIAADLRMYAGKHVSRNRASVVSPHSFPLELFPAEETRTGLPFAK